MKKCFDEGTLQAYLDGELSPEREHEAAQHVVQCDACADALAEAENESVFFATAFAPDNSVSVPTEQLRARIKAAVAQLESPDASERGKTTYWNLGAMLGSLAGLFTLAPRRAGAFASLLAVVVFALVFVVSQRQPGNPARVGDGDIARHDAPAVAMPEAVNPNRVDVKDAQKGVQVAAAVPTPKQDKVKVVNAAFKRASKEAAPRTPKEAGASTAEKRAPEKLLPGEKDYREAIASLSRTIEAGGEVVLRPKVRADYERNLAVLDKAIAETRGAVLRNPKDKDAVSFLMSAYQSKVELLTTVADQAQVATLGR